MEIKEIVFASRNVGKIAEVSTMLAPLGISVKSALDLDLEDVEETGKTFEENAYLKAFAACKATQRPALADDSGLCVKALNGAPGVYSARYAPERNFVKGMQKLLAEMAKSGSADRSAYFACVLVLAFPDGSYKSFEGRIEGKIALEPHGFGGFGYDPLFMPEGKDKTFAELDSDYKNKTSHRAKAMQKLKEYLQA